MMFDLLFKGLAKVGDIVGGGLREKLVGVIAEVQEAAGKDPAVEQALLAQEVEIKKIVAADLEGARQLIREEGRSEDAFVRRARPAFLWLFYLVIIFNFVAAPILNQFGILGTMIYPTLPEELYWLFGTSFTGYAGFRSWDKKRKAPSQP